MCDKFSIQNGLKKETLFSPLFFTFALKYAKRSAQENPEGLKLYKTHHLLIYANDV